MWRFCFLTVFVVWVLSGGYMTLQWLLLLWGLLTADGDLVLSSFMRVLGATLLFGGLTWVAAWLLDNEPAERR